MSDFGGSNGVDTHNGVDPTAQSNPDSDIEALLRGARSGGDLTSPKEHVSNDDVKEEATEENVAQEESSEEDSDYFGYELEEVEESGNRRGDLSWGDVAQIWNFGVKFSKATPQFRDAFSSVTECYGDPVMIARELTIPNYRLTCIDTVIGIMNAKRNGDMMFVLELGVQLGAMSVDEMRALVKTSNALAFAFTESGYEPITISYRRNMDSGQVIKTIMSAVSSLNDDAFRFLKWTKEMFSTWPGGNISA